MRAYAPKKNQDMHLSCSVTLEKKGTLFWEDHFSNAATKKKGETGSH